MNENGYDNNQQYNTGYNQQYSGQPYNNAYDQQYSGQPYNNGYDQQYGGQSYNNGYDQQYGGSLREAIPNSLVEHLPEHMKDDLESAIASAEQQLQSRNAMYENAESSLLSVQMKPSLTLTALAIGLGGMFLFAAVNIKLMFLCFGIMMTIFGIGFVSDPKFNFRKHAKSTLVFFLGLVMVLISGYLLLADLIPALPQVKRENLLDVVGIGFAVVGLLLLVLNFISFHYFKTVCTEQVQGTCVYLKRKVEYQKGHERVQYAPVYEYQFRGNTYCAAEEFSEGGVPSVGDRFDLYINPMAPTEFYRKEWRSKVKIVVFCIVFLAFGYLFICIP